MIKGVIFDMDGVLVDNRDIHIEAFIIFCRRYGVEFSHETIMNVFGRGNDDIMPLLLPAEVIEQKGLQTLANEKEAIYREIFADTITPTKGLVQFLNDLKANNILMAVGSSGQSANVNFVLERCGIAQYFNAIVNGDMVSNCKPDPEIFNKAVELLGLTPQECLVIEDSFDGIKAARRAKTKVIALATTFSSERLLDTDNDLIALDFTQLNNALIQTL